LLAGLLLNLVLLAPRSRPFPPQVLVVFWYIGLFFSWGCDILLTDPPLLWMGMGPRRNFYSRCNLTPFPPFSMLFLRLFPHDATAPNPADKLSLFDSSIIQSHDALHDLFSRLPLLIFSFFFFLARAIATTQTYRRSSPSGQGT